MIKVNEIKVTLPYVFQTAGCRHHARRRAAVHKEAPFPGPKEWPPTDLEWRDPSPFGVSLTGRNLSFWYDTLLCRRIVGMVSFDRNTFHINALKNLYKVCRCHPAMLHVIAIRPADTKGYARLGQESGLPLGANCRNTIGVRSQLREIVCRRHCEEEEMATLKLLTDEEADAIPAVKEVFDDIRAIRRVRTS